MLWLPYVTQQFFNALVVGCFYSLLAVSYSLVHGITNRIILSFGDMAMVCAFAAIYGAIIGLSAGWEIGAVIAAGLVSAVACSAGLGVGTLKAVFAPLLGNRSQALLIVSLGVGLVLQEVMRIQSGGREQWLEPMLSDAVIQSSPGGFVVRVSLMQASIIAGTATFLSLLAVVMRVTALGRFWRACSEDAVLVALIGIDVRRVTTATFVAASIYAALAGFTLAIYYGGVSFYMGLMLGLKALFASIIGGFGTLSGAIAGGFVLAFIETAWAAFFPLGYRDVAVFGIILSILILRPEGLFGTETRQDYR